MEFAASIWSKMILTYAWEAHMQERQHIRRASYSRGGILFNVTVLSGNMEPFGFEEEQRNPDLVPFTDGEAEFEPPAKRVKK